ncbi:TFIIB-type zinc ribbon-containing protein [Alteromonas lipotrueae]|uniref:TFIIB-type zinc ribbon-containing protein n=1 Tax=Alteromonas lipotrueae TaxID=2803814 RepID=UPI001C463461
MKKKYICPKCGSEDTYKERVNGADSGDRICKSCGYTTSANSFKPKEEDDSEQKL